jgi:hypothetical protein
MTVSLKQGDLALLQDPVAQELLHARIPARFAYTWLDGTPRVIPIAFLWNGHEIVLGTFPRSPKVRALQHNPHVALTIEPDGFPAKILQIRGTATMTTATEIVPELAEAVRRFLGEEAGAAQLQQLAALLPYGGGQTRIAVRPEWVGIIDFEQRVPSATERAMAAMQAALQATV